MENANVANSTEDTNEDVIAWSELTSSKVNNNLNDYKVIASLTKNIKESMKDIENNIYVSLKNKGYKVPDVLNDIVLISNDDIETGDINKLTQYVKDHLVDINSYDKVFGSFSDDDIRDQFRDMHKSYTIISTLEKDYIDVMNDSKQMLSDYFNYISSSRVEDSLRNRLDIMKSMVELDDNDNPKDRKKIEILEKTLDYSFILDKLDVDRTVEVYFKDNLSSYVVSKYESKIKRYGYNPNIFRHFLSIEETFLDEKYHPFNNLFLFIYMRFVGYTDPSRNEDELYVRSITSALGNLIYHKFNTSDTEKSFISFIESILDKFIDNGYTDRFIMDNISYKNNESNIQARKAADDLKRQVLIDKLKYYNIEYSDDMSVDELNDLFEKAYNDLKNSLLNENKDDVEIDATVTAAEDKLGFNDMNDAIKNIKESENNNTDINDTVTDDSIKDTDSE